MRDVTMRGAAALQAWLVALRHRTEGATSAQYGLLAALIAVAVIVAVRFLGTSLSGVFNKTGSTISNAAT